MERSTLLKKDFKNILKKWKQVLDEPETEVNRDAAILRFELAFEVGWKLIKLAAEWEGYEVKKVPVRHLSKLLL